MALKPVTVDEMRELHVKSQAITNDLWDLVSRMPQTGMLSFNAQTATVHYELRRLAELVRKLKVAHDNAEARWLEGKKLGAEAHKREENKRRKS